jgi:hypothetical protein
MIMDSAELGPESGCSGKAQKQLQIYPLVREGSKLKKPTIVRQKRKNWL